MILFFTEGNENNKEGFFILVCWILIRHPQIMSACKTPLFPIAKRYDVEIKPQLNYGFRQLMVAKINSPFSLFSAIKSSV